MPDSVSMPANTLEAIIRAVGLLFPLLPTGRTILPDTFLVILLHRPTTITTITTTTTTTTTTVTMVAEEMQEEDEGTHQDVKGIEAPVDVPKT